MTDDTRLPDDTVALRQSLVRVPWERDGLARRLLGDELRAPGTDWTPFDPELDADVDPDDRWDDDARGEMTVAAFAAIGIALLAGLFALVIGRVVRRVRRG